MTLLFSTTTTLLLSLHATSLLTMFAPVGNAGEDCRLVWSLVMCGVLLVVDW